MRKQYSSGNRRTIAVTLAGFCAFLGLNAPQPLLPQLARAFHRSPGRMSMIVTITTLSVAVAAPFVGSISDKWGRKSVIMLASLLLVIPTLFAGTATSYAQLVFWRFLQGLLTPGIIVVTVTYINEEWGNGAAVATTAYVSGTVLGGFVGRSIAAFVSAHYSWHWAFIVLSALNLLGGLTVWFCLPKEQCIIRQIPAGTKLVFWNHLRNPLLLATYFAGFCILFSLLGTFTYVNFYLSAPPFDLNTQALGVVFVVYLIGAGLTFLAGRLIGQFAHHVAFSFAMILSIIGCLITLSHHLPLVIAGLALFCTGLFIVQASANAFIGLATKNSKAAAVGLYVTFYYLGGTLGATIPGLMWSWGGWAACVGLMCTVSIAVIVVIWLSWSKIPGSQCNNPSELIAMEGITGASRG